MSNDQLAVQYAIVNVVKKVSLRGVTTTKHPLKGLCQEMSKQRWKMGRSSSFGWWFPEDRTDVCGWDRANINVLTRSEPPYDPGIGTVNLRGIPCRVYSATQGQ